MTQLQDAYEARIRKAGLERDPAQAAVVEQLDTLRAALTRTRAQIAWPWGNPSVRGVYLWGAVGRGKSMLMEMLFAELGEVPRRRVHFHAFMQEIHDALHAARQAGAEDPIAAATDSVTGRIKILALDEMEITDIVDATIVGRVFERMLARDIVPVVTSNRPPAELYRDGLKRDLFTPFLRLIEERLDVLHLTDGDDYRGRGGTASEVFLVPADDGARDRMDALWRQLAPGGATQLDLGHGAAVEFNGSGAARASFDDLCERPLGPAEYLRLVESTSLLLLDGIPRLGEKRHDAARRFVTLIDVLYDAECGLVATAAAPPEELYPEGEGDFEFRRTVSRLNEMRTPEWTRVPDGIGEPDGGAIT